MKNLISKLLLVALVSAVAGALIGPADAAPPPPPPPPPPPVGPVSQ